MKTLPFVHLVPKIWDKKATYTMADLYNPFAQHAARAVANTLELDESLFVVSEPPNPEFGDIAVGCFPAAKALKKSPAQIATMVADAFGGNEFLKSATAKGPFVNFWVHPQKLIECAVERTVKSHALFNDSLGAGKTICVDFSSPNISKQLAYHHIRSTVIGNALCKMHRALGYHVMGINHLGDWGTTHGMVIEAYNRWGHEGELDVAALNELYVRFRNEMKTDPTLADAGREAFAKLEQGDERTVSLWNRFKELSLKEFQTIYDILNIEFDEIKGESQYAEDVPKVLKELDDKGLSSMSDGALVVEFEEKEDMPPLLLRKKDGSTLYGTRDIAAAHYRKDKYNFEKSYYVVGRGQGLHFKQLFKTLSLAGHAWSEDCKHIPFGLVRIAGKKTSTRSGQSILLKDVFDEAQKNATEKIQSKNPDMPQNTLKASAQTVGVGAVVFANLMRERDKDVDFVLEDILSTDGDSGPYVQYAYARLCQVFNKTSQKPSLDADFSKLGSTHEKRLAHIIMNFGDVVERATRHCDPHIVSRYLLDLASEVSRFYTAGNQDKALRILCEDEATQIARLTLVKSVQVTLETGLELLGVGVVENM